MNWKLIFSLSLFGLLMGAITVSVVPSNIEPWCWLTVFIICAYIVAKQAPGRYFLHGFLVSLVNCVWVTGAHVLFYTTYIAHHPDFVQMTRNTALGSHLRKGMLITGPIIGVISGLVLGLFCFIASLLMKKQRPAAHA